MPPFIQSFPFSMFSLAILTLSEPPVDDPMARISFEKKFQVMAYLRNMLTKIGTKNKLIQDIPAERGYTIIKLDSAHK
jgi:hypothetical protein